MTESEFNASGTGMHCNEMHTFSLIAYPVGGGRVQEGAALGFAFDFLARGAVGEVVEGGRIQLDALDALDALDTFNTWVFGVGFAFGFA